MEHPNTGKPPRDKTVALRIRWANGKLDKHTYTAGQLRWTITGCDFDIGTYWRANGADEGGEHGAESVSDDHQAKAGLRGNSRG